MHTSIYCNINRTDGPVTDGKVQAPRHLLASQENPAASRHRPRHQAVATVGVGIGHGRQRPPRHLLASLVRADLASLVRVDPAPPQAVHLAIGDMVDGVVMDGPDGAVDQAAHQERVVRVDQDLASLVRVDQDLLQAVHQETNGDHRQVGDILLRRHHHQGRAASQAESDRHTS